MWIFNLGQKATIRAGIIALSLIAANCTGKTYSTLFQPFDLVFNGGGANPSVSTSLVAATPLTNTRVMLTFNKPVSLSSAQTVGNYQITDANGNLLHILAVSRDPSNSNIVFVDTIPQVAGTQYTVTASNLFGVDGSSLGSNNRATFTAPTNADNTGPTISSVSALNATTIELFFNEAVDASTLGTYAVRNAPGCGSVYNSNVSAVRDSSNFAKVTLTLTSGTNLAPGGSYAVQVTGVRDIWGNASTPCSNDFTLVAPTPKVSSVTSASPSTVLVTFSEDMDSTGIAGTALLNRTIYTINQCSGGGSLILNTNGTLVGTKSVLFSGVTTSGTVNQGNCSLSITIPGGTTCDTTAGLICSAAGARLTTAGNTGVLQYNNTVANDTVAPAVLSVTTSGANKVVVTFSEDVTGVTAGDFNFSPALNITGVSCTANVCTLTTDDQSATPYSLSITNTNGGIQDLATPANTLNSGSSTFTGDGKPYIIGIYPDDTNTIFVKWSEAIDSTTGADYIISGYAGSITAVLYPSSPSDMVKLTLSPAMTPGTPYTLTLNTSPNTVTDTSTFPAGGNPAITTIPGGGTFTSPAATVTASPYIVSASSTAASIVIVNFNEPINNASLATAGAGVFTLGGLGCPASATAATQISAGVIQLTVNAGSAATAQNCYVQIAAGVLSDLAANTNAATTPPGVAYNYLGTGGADTTAPTVVSAIALDNTHVQVFFSEVVTSGTGQNSANYSFSPALSASPGIASISCSGASCTLTLNAPGTSAVQYALTVKDIQDATTNTMAQQTVNFSGIGSSVAAPTLYMASLINSTTVELSFSEIMDLTSAQNTANYSVTGGNLISAAVVQGDATKVRLTIAPGAFGSSTSYTVTVSQSDTDGAGPITGVKDASGVALGSPNSATFNGSGTAPAATDLAAASDKGSSNTDNITSSSAIPGMTFGGTVAPNTTVVLYDDGVPVAATTSLSSGIYTLVLNSATTLAASPTANNFTVATVSASGVTSDQSPALAVYYDTSVPSVEVSAAPADGKGVTSTVANGSYGPGSVIPITVKFTEAVYVDTTGGTPYLTLVTTSPATTNISYSSGSGTDTLTFNYTVASGNSNADLNYQNTTSLNLNGGAIFDLGGNTATLTLPATGANGSLGTNKTITVVGSITGVISYDQSGNVSGNVKAGNVTITATYALDPGSIPTIAINQPGSTDISAVAMTQVDAQHYTYTYTVVTANGSTYIDGSATITLSTLSSNNTFTIDTAAPAATSTPDMTAATDSGVNTDNVTNNATPSFTVTCENGASVQLYNGVTAIGSAVTCASGTATLVASTLTDGTYTTINAVQTDSALNASPASGNLTINIDTGVPAAPSIPDLLAASDTGISSTDDYTSNATPSFSVTCENGTSVQLYDGASATGSAVTCAGGVATLVAATLSSGTHASIHAVQTDTAGNTSAVSGNISVTIDTTAPAATSAPDLTNASDTGSSNIDNITNVTTPSFTVTCENGASVQLYDGASATGSAGTCSGGVVTLTAATLSAGTHASIHTIQTDVAGNVSPVSGNLSITIDTTADAAPGIPDLTNASDTGSSNTDNITNVTTPSFTVSCVTGSSVQLYDGASATGSAVTCAAGTATVTASALSAGTHASMNAIQTDAAGNVSPASGNLSITIDATADAAPGAPDMTSATDTGSSNSDDITSNTTPSFTVSCVNGSSVQLYDGVSATGSAVTCAGGTATLTAAALSAGVHASINARQTDTAGNLSPASGNLSVTIDTTADAAPGTPDLTNASDAGSSNTDNITNVTTPSFTVSCVDGSSVQLYDGASATGSAVVCASSTATLTAATLSAGTHASINAKQTDPAGNQSIASGNLSITIDTTADAAPGIPDLTNASDTGSSNTDNLTNVTTPSFTVSCVNGSSVQLYDGATATGTPVTCAGGTATVTAGTLSSGVHASMNAIQTDVAGNASPASGNLSITIDNTADAATGTPDMTSATDSGLSNSDDYTSNTTPSFTVSCVTGSSVQLYDGVSATGSAVTCSAGSATLTPAALSSGAHSINAQQTDAAGNQSVASGSLSVTIDTTNPAAPGAPDLTNASDTGISNTDNITSVTTPSFTVSCENGASVQLYDGVSATGSAGTCSGGTVTLTAATLSAGTHASMNAIQTDVAGNLSPASGNLSITIDGTNPAATGTPDLVAASDTGSSNTDNITSSTTPSFTVSCENGASVQLYDGASATGSAGTCAGGTVTLTAGTLSAGTHASMNAIQTDAAGNVSPASGNLSITIDNVAPATTSTPDLIAASDSGPSNTDNITNVTTPSFTVTCENGASVQLYDGASATGSAVTCAAGTATLVAATLSATTHANMNAIQTDAAGNVSTASSGLSITIDTTAPAVTGTPDLTNASDSGSSNTDNITNVTTPAFTMTCENGASVQLYDGASATGSAGTCSSGTVTLTAGTLSAGTHASINAIQTDAAGNVSSASGNLSITIDTTAPVITLVSPASSATITNTNVSYTLSEAVASGTITWTRTGGTADSNHPQALAGTELATGAHTGITLTNNPTLVIGSIYTITWDVTDAAGNAAVTVTSTSVTYANPTGPVITAAEYYDTDNNGRIDHVKLTFDKVVSDSTMDGYTATGTPANQLHNITTVWAIAGYTNVRMDTRDTIGSYTGDNVTDDAVIWLAFDEIGSGNYDTNAKPNLTATDSSLRGTAAVGSCYIMTSFANCSTQSFADIVTASVVETDKAPAIIVGATGITSSQYLTITFSEPVDNTNDGACSGTLGYSDIKYNDVSASGITDIDSVVGNWNDVDACSDKTVRPRLAAGGTPSNLDAPSVNIDTVNPIANRVYDVANNVSLTTPAEPVQYAIEPYVVSVTATAARKIRITFSEAVQTAAATTLANYTLVESPVESGCAGSGSNTVNLTGSVTQISTAVYELSTDADQCSTTTYSLTANATNIKDVNENLGLKTPNFGTFLGNERLKVSSATCTSLASFNVAFNKAVASGTGTGGAEAVTRYSASGASTLGSLSTAVRGTSPNDNIVTITHTVNQTGTSYTLIASNATNGDGFDDAALGVIQTFDLSESLQSSPRDRAIFSGCGTAITDFSQGPISTNPFGDATDVGQIVSYDNKVYIGTNNKGNNVARFNPDGTSPTLAGFEFLKDTATVDLSSNTATTRDGGIAVPPFVTLGFSGCTTNNAGLNTGCGPDNEDGRGTFTVGTIGSTNYLFLGGSRSAANFNYLHYTSDVDSTLNFKYIDMGTITGTATQGLESIIVFGDRVYPGMAKQNTGGGQNLPDFGKINFSTGSAQGDCTPGNSCEATDGTNGARFRIDRMPYFGGDSNDGGAENTGLNRAWIVGVDSLFVFNSKIYAANGGYHSVGGNGSIIRSNNSNPAVCTAEDVCPDWTEIGPRTDAKWHNSPTNNRFSLQLTKIANIIQNDRAFAQFAQFNGNLYVTRTACTIADGGGSGAQTSAPAADAGCNDGTDTNRVAQLWKCTPATTGSATDCDAGDWTVVGDNSTGITNFGSAGNKTMSMLVANGSYLYVGFDNANGIEIWRTNTANPGSSSASWSQISTAGLGDITNLKQIFSAITIQDGTDYYIYIAAGKNGVPIAIYRQKNL